MAYSDVVKKVIEKRERQAHNYADGGGSRDHSGDPIVLTDLLLSTGVLKRLPADRLEGWKLNTLV